MSLTLTETQILWASATSVTINSATPVVSDAFAIDPTTIAASIQISADNAGTPASGDTVTAQIAYTLGDILGDSGDDYDTTEHAAPLMVLDTYATNTPGEDPTRKTSPISIGVKGGKLIVTCPQADARNIVIHARLVEKRSA
jgi:hypothetical protein